MGGGAAVTLWALCCFIALLSTKVAEAGRETASSYPSPTQKQGACNYTIIIETTCADGAGTSDRVSMRFGDASSTDVLVHPLKTRRARTVDGAARPAVLDDVPRRPFRGCATDVFEASGDCVQSRVCYLFLRHRGEDKWRPGRVQVLVHGDGRLSSGSFYFRRFLPQQVWHGFDVCEAQITPFGARRTRKVLGGGRGKRSP